MTVYTIWWTGLIGQNVWNLALGCRLHLKYLVWPGAAPNPAMFFCPLLLNPWSNWISTSFSSISWILWYPFHWTKTVSSHTSYVFESYWIIGFSFSNIIFTSCMILSFNTVFTVCFLLKRKFSVSCTSIFWTIYWYWVHFLSCVFVFSVPV